MVLKIGDSGAFSKTITESDVYNFAGISGDFNPIHIDVVAAKKSLFGSRIVHGMLLGSLISTVIGTRMPGEGTIYLEQNMKFLSPAYFGDTCIAEVTVNEVVNETKGIYRLGTVVKNQNGKLLLDGYAVVKYQKETSR